MRPIDIQVVGQELAIKWEDASETYLKLERLRQFCPCAGCKGEVDVMGKLYKAPARELPAQAYELRRIIQVGGYAIQPVWGDGHSTGIYSYEYLKRLAVRGEE